MSPLVFELISCVISLAAFLYGMVNLCKKAVPLYFNRCLLQTYDRGTPSLIQTWNGGYFGNMVIRLKSGNSYRQEKTYVAANGIATKKIPSGIFKAESGKYFSGWDADIISNGMTVLTAKWSDHIHTTSCKDTIYNEKHQPVTCHTVNVNDTENGKPVSGVVVNGYVLPFIKHMVVTEKGTLKSDSSISNRVYIYGTDDLEVTLNHDGSFVSSIFDNSSILLICISAAIVAAGIAVAVIISRKRKKEKKTDA